MPIKDVQIEVTGKLVEKRNVARALDDIHTRLLNLEKAAGTISKDAGEDAGEDAGSGPVDTDPSRCLATTGSGAQCKRPALDGKNWCSTKAHEKQVKKSLKDGTIKL